MASDDWIRVISFDIIHDINFDILFRCVRGVYHRDNRWSWRLLWRSTHGPIGYTIDGIPLHFNALVTHTANFVSRSSQDDPNNFKLFVKSRQACRDVLEIVWQLHLTDFLLAVTHDRLRSKEHTVTKLPSRPMIVSGPPQDALRRVL